MKFYSEITKEMYDSIEALNTAENKFAQDDVRAAAEKLKKEVGEYAQKALELEQESKAYEEKALDLERKFCREYGIEAFREYLLAPAIKDLLSQVPNKPDFIKKDKVSNDFQDMIKTFLSK